jgi:predicted amidohydrolase YtcJ
LQIPVNNTATASTGIGQFPDVDGSHHERRTLHHQRLAASRDCRSYACIWMMNVGAPREGSSDAANADTTTPAYAGVDTSASNSGSSFCSLSGPQ